MATYLLFHAPLRRFAASAKPWPPALLLVVALAGCGTAEDLDGPDPVFYTDAAGSASDNQLLTSQATPGTAEPGGVVAGATERPAPPEAIPVVRGKPR